MVRYKGNQEEHLKHLDNFGGLMSFWCRDENCNKTLGEVLPLYEEYLNQKKESKLSTKIKKHDTITKKRRSRWFGYYLD